MFSSYTATTFILTFLSSKKINKDNKKEKEKEKKMEEKEKILSVLFSTFSFFLYYVEWSRRKTEFTSQNLLQWSVEEKGLWKILS